MIDTDITLLAISIKSLENFAELWYYNKYQVHGN